jgi:DNA-directed RNA polymerase subunit RPC12/RpoP
MTDYTGINCPVCGKAFTTNDDIVVCPKCGAPYHRECYAEVGKCVFEEKHGTPEAWSPPELKPAQQKAAVNFKRCPNCGTENSENAIFCEHCGQMLTQNQSDFHEFPKNGGFPPFGGYNPNGTPINSNQSNQPNVPPNGYPGQVPYIFDPMGGVNPNEPIENVPSGDVAKLVQNNTHYYLPVFMDFHRFRRNRFNFSAFLFSGGWMLYRKQYKLGSIITSIMAVLVLISTYVSINYTMPLEQALFNQVGLSADSASITYDQIRQASELLAQKPPEQVLLFCIPPIITLIQLIIMIVVGIYGNRWYLKHCIDTISQIHEETKNPTEVAIQLQEQGGINTPLAICLLICYMILMYIPTLY